MLAIICAAFLTLPLYPLNPVEQDTVSTINLHLTAGVSSHSGMISAGPELTAKFEYLFNHPFIFRSSLDYIYGEIKSNNYPNGTMHRQSLSTEVVYYRGTKKITAYLGLGIVYGRGIFNLSDSSFFDDETDGIPQEINVGHALGYRFLMGLRFKHKYSIEVTITEISPSFIYFRRTSATSYSEEEFEFRANYFKVSLGYLFKLK